MISKSSVPDVGNILDRRRLVKAQAVVAQLLGQVRRPLSWPAHARHGCSAISHHGPTAMVDGRKGRMAALLGSSRCGSRRGVPEIGPVNVSALVQAREEC